MSVTDEQVLSDHLDLEMLERPHLWPSLVRGERCVFVKRINFEYNQTGPCYKTNGGYVVAAHDWNEGGKVDPLSYATAEEIVAAGWSVD